MPGGRRVWWAILVVALCVAAVVVITTLSTEGSKRYEADSFAFSYPSEWEQIEGLEFPLAEGTLEEGMAGRNVVGIDADSWVSVDAVDNRTAIDRDNIRDLIPSQRQILVETAMVLGTVQIRQEPFVVENEVLPATRSRLLFDNPRGTEVVSTVTELFDGTTQYIVNCQADADSREEIERGCRQVLDTFEALGQEGER